MENICCNYKKYMAEMIGTCVLVLMGCGAAALAGGTDAGAIGWAGVSLAFGLSVMVMVYAIGPISGCHINPAITLAMFINRKISGKDALMYVASQIIGAFIGILLLGWIAGHFNGLAVNAVDPYDLGYTTTQAFVCEFVMTCLFLLVIFGATSEKAPAGFAGIAIGLSLTLIHLVSIPVTNTSVNPARSIAAAVVDWDLNCGVTDMWLFIIAPLAGAAVAALIWRCLSSEKTCEKSANE